MAPDAEGQANAVQCGAEAAAVRFDHVVIAVTDLGSASSTERSLPPVLAAGVWLLWRDGLP